MNLTEEAAAYHQQLLDSPDALRWHHQRGISDEAIRKFHLGWIGQPASEAAAPYRGWYALPYLTTTGKIIQLKARRPDGGKPKYMKVGEDFPFAEPKTHLFNASAAMPTLHRSEVFVVEGEYDAVIGWQAGLKTVAVPSATAWYPAWTFLFEDSEVVLAFDGDEAGRKGAARLEQELVRHHVDVRTRSLPVGKDVTDLWLDGGAERVRAALLAG